MKAVIRHPSEVHGVARRANAILLLDKGWNCVRVAEAFFWTTTRFAIVIGTIVQAVLTH